MREVKFITYVKYLDGTNYMSKPWTLEEAFVESQGFSGKSILKRIYRQFTGLKDKKGKEIYSGDLFNCIYHFDGCTKHRLEVYWNSEAVGFKLRGVSGECHQPNVIQTMSDMTRQEVIGNIYENPELLK